LHQREKGQIPRGSSEWLFAAKKQSNKDLGGSWFEKLQGFGHMLHNNMCNNSQHKDKAN
jgi:hypothetical protein